MTVISASSKNNPGSILKTIAKSLGSKIEEHLNQCKVEIPEDKGEGYIQLFSFSFGISLLIYNLTLKQTLKLYYDYENIHPLKIKLVKKGNLIHNFKGGEKVNVIKEFESVVAASTPESSHIFKIPQKQKIITLSIQINRKEFETKIEDYLLQMNSELSKIFRDVNGIITYYEKDYYSPETLNLIDTILEIKKEDFTEMVKLEGITYQLITNILENLIEKHDNTHPTSLTTKTRQKVKEAVDLITNDIENYKGIKHLANTLYINEKTLQSAFKKIYNCTINTYVRNFRAKQAAILLKNTDLTISEVAYKLGLNSSSQLSQLYKFYYNRLPSEDRSPK